MLRALQLRSILVTSVSRKAASSAPRTRVAVPKFTKKANLISTWSKKRAWTAESMKKATVVSTRSYSTSMPFRDMNKTELELLMSGNPDNYVLIDVREPDELRHGTIPNAHNLPLAAFQEAFAKTSEEFEDKHGFPKPAPNDKVILCCKSGARSGSAAKYLAQLGYRDVYNYPGFQDWFGRGY